MEILNQKLNGKKIDYRACINIGIKMEFSMLWAKQLMARWMVNGSSIIQIVNYRLIRLIKWGNVFGKKFGEKMGKFARIQNWKMEMVFFTNTLKMETLPKNGFFKMEWKLNPHPTSSLQTSSHLDAVFIENRWHLIAICIIKYPLPIVLAFKIISFCT